MILYGSSFILSDIDTIIEVLSCSTRLNTQQELKPKILTEVDLHIRPLQTLANLMLRFITNNSLIVLLDGDHSMQFLSVLPN